MKSLYSIVTAATLLSACAVDDGPEIESTREELLELLDISTDRELAGKIRSAHRVDSTQIDELANKGTMTVRPFGLPPEECRITGGVHRVLSRFHDTKKSYRVGLAYKHGAGHHPHADTGTHGNPQVTECLTRAMDIYAWQGNEIHIMNPEGAKNAIVDIIETLPPGTYDLGLPRAPYPNTWSDAAAIASQFGTYGQTGPLVGLFDAGNRRLWPWIDVEAYHEFLDYRGNEHSACVGVPNCSGPAAELNQIRNPTFRQEIVAAVERAKHRGVVITAVYPDALDHMHVGVQSARPAPAPTAYDFDGDGRADILWRRNGSGENTIWHVNGGKWAQHETWLSTIGDAGWRLVGAADFDGDTFQDLVWFHAGTGLKSLWHMDGPRYRNHREAAQASFDPSWTMQAVGDFDGDGSPELLWQHLVTEEVGIWTFDGNLVMSPALLPRKSATWVAGGAASFDGVDPLLAPKGTSDIVWRDYETGAVEVWYMLGGVVQSTEQLQAVGPDDDHWKLRGVADYDADGDPDLLWRDVSPGGRLMVRPLQHRVQTQGQAYDLSPVADTAWMPAGAQE